MLPCALTSFCIFQQRHRLLWHVKAHLATFSGCSAIAQLTCFFDCFGTTTSVWVRHLRGVQEVPLLLFGMFIVFQDGARCSCFLGFAHQLFRFWFVPFAVCALVVFFLCCFASTSSLWWLFGSPCSSVFEHVTVWLLVVFGWCLDQQTFATRFGF